MSDLRRDCAEKSAIPFTGSLALKMPNRIHLSLHSVALRETSAR
jgi:hypothetical protein